jgi:hypothetical protein
MHQPRHRHVRVLTARVGHVVRRRPALLHTRDNLPANRAVRIVPLDQIEKVRRDRQREFRAGEQDTVPFVIGELEMLLELRQRGDAILELPPPIVPLLGRHIRPKAGRMRDELFPIRFARGKCDHFLCEAKVNVLNYRVNVTSGRIEYSSRLLRLLRALRLNSARAPHVQFATHATSDSFAARCVHCSQPPLCRTTRGAT